MAYFNILIVEDNLAFAVNLEMNLIEWGHTVVGIADNSEMALTMIEAETPDVILMDININGNMNGIELAKTVSDKNISIIYMTGLRDEITFEAAKTPKCISYLVKPFDMVSLKGVLVFSPQLNSKETNAPKKTALSSILLRKGKKLIPVNVNEIDWIESDGNYLDIFVDGDRYTMRKSLKAIMESLSSDNFIKIHKQYIVKIEAIEEVFLTDNKVKVKGDFLPIGRKYKSDLLNKLNRFA